ncbi:hypothetical protein TR51_11960 [Kitasatospora griseola]|uniref:Uncharacterized protein n=1 Tax=Kitasatospora griseola TaxID=2064 RepID=A0A0D0PWX0_KITGR|nr:hypothetical protein TR51_11960 [Kitasatospora griseola]
MVGRARRASKVERSAFGAMKERMRPSTAEFAAAGQSTSSNLVRRQLRPEATGSAPSGVIATGWAVPSSNSAQIRGIPPLAARRCRDRGRPISRPGPTDRL